MQQKQNIHLENFLYWLLLAIHLLPILQNKYFLTGDGPSHVYNAKVVLDYVQDKNWDFYEQYYEFNSKAEPNWLSHALLASLISIFPDYLAEKILILLYALVFIFAWRFLIRQINPQNYFIVLLGIPFVFQHTFQKGFYNYSFSIALMFWVLAYWLKIRQALSPKALGLLSLSWIFLYFAHPVGLSLSWLLIGLLLLGEWLLEKAASLKDLLLESGKILLAALPALGLFLSYMLRRGTETTPNPFSWAHMGRKFVELTSLVNFTNKEVNWAIAFSITIGILFLFGLMYKVRKRKFNRFDAFFIAFLICLAMYFLQPGSIGGAGILYIRLQFIPFLMILLWLAAIPFKRSSIHRYSLSAFFISIVLISLRAPHHKLASIAVQEYLELREHIEDRSSVLPLSFAHQGLTPEGKNVAKRIWLFMHAGDYLGSEKSLVMLGNYEAGLGYFPLIWKDDKQPYFHLGVKDNIEGRPPGVDLLSYPKKTGGSVDYVITWCMEGEFKDHPNTVEIRGQLAKKYELIFSSSNELAKLYRLKDS
ncbi:MAG: hypothetical protein AAF696_03460 [Bacteroidota bacterium]